MEYSRSKVGYFFNPLLEENVVRVIIPLGSRWAFSALLLLCCLNVYSYEIRKLPHEIKYSPSNQTTLNLLLLDSITHDTIHTENTLELYRVGKEKPEILKYNWDEGYTYCPVDSGNYILDYNRYKTLPIHIRLNHSNQVVLFVPGGILTVRCSIDTSKIFPYPVHIVQVRNRDTVPIVKGIIDSFYLAAGNYCFAVDTLTYPNGQLPQITIVPSVFYQIDLQEPSRLIIEGVEGISDFSLWREEFGDNSLITQDIQMCINKGIVLWPSTSTSYIVRWTDNRKTHKVRVKVPRLENIVYLDLSNP